MAKQFPELAAEHIEFIQQQHIFFVGTAAAEGFVNLSPKGMDSFRIINNNEIAWLNLTGSGNETAAHILENPRMTIMFCSFTAQPLILRLYGSAEVIHTHDQAWSDTSAQFPDYTGARQIFKLKLDLVQTSCGFAVPYYEYAGERPTLDKWAIGRGREGIKEYWQEKNTRSMNGKPTGILVDSTD